MVRGWIWGLGLWPIDLKAGWELIKREIGRSVEKCGWPPEEKMTTEKPGHGRERVALRRIPHTSQPYLPWDTAEDEKRVMPV